MMQSVNLDPRIGVFNSGLFYAFADGYDKPETVGTLEAVEKALGLRTVTATKATRPVKEWTVVMRFEHPAWDELDGIAYQDIIAVSKADANRKARILAERDGHAIGGRGRFTFTATEN
jgi:hypothetical protein